MRSTLFLALASTTLVAMGCASSTTAPTEPTAMVEDRPGEAIASAPTEASGTTDPNTTTPATPAEAEAETVSFYADNGVAIGGADPVAYFTEGAYVPGTEDYTHDWGGATWQFASVANRDAFASEPDRYAPQYGGFCAWAVSQGYTAPIDPTAWKVVEGKLYLNYDAKIQARWAQDIPGNIAKANVNWPEVLAQ